VEKAFDFSGMGARNGVMAATMVEAGMTGVYDVLDGTHNLFIALSAKPDPEAMVADLGQRFFIEESSIKTFSVGYPNQSALDAMLHLRREHGFGPDQVRAVRVKLPSDAIGIVGNSAMADVSCQHLVSLALLKGAVSFEDSHDATLMSDPQVLALRERLTLIDEPALMDPAAPRGAIVEVDLLDGRSLSHHTRFAPGTKERPLTTDQVNAKAQDLMVPVLGLSKTQALIEAVNRLETVADMRSLRPLWQA
jgi:2-methylcitrate dehydratase PrpD